MKRAKYLNADISSTNSPTDSGIWQSIKSGDKSALSALYKQYVQQLFRYGYFLVPDKDIVEDAIHDLFVRIWTKRNNQIDIHSIKNYLFVSLRREVLSKKRELAHLNHRLDSIEESLFYHPSVEESLIDQEHKQGLIRQIRTYINNLTDRQREIIHLRYYQNLSYPEIAELLDIDQNYAYNLLSRAFTQLRKQFHL